MLGRGHSPLDGPLNLAYREPARSFLALPSPQLTPATARASDSNNRRSCRCDGIVRRLTAAPAANTIAVGNVRIFIRSATRPPTSLITREPDRPTDSSKPSIWSVEFAAMTAHPGAGNSPNPRATAVQVVHFVESRTTTARASESIRDGNPNAEGLRPSSSKSGSS